MEKIDTGLVFQSKTTKQTINTTISLINEKLQNKNIKKKRKETLKTIKKKLENSILTSEDMIKYNNYIDNIFNRYNTDIIRTYNSPFNPYLKNIIYHFIHSHILVN